MKCQVEKCMTIFHQLSLLVVKAAFQIAARKPYVSPILVRVMACHRKLHLYLERLQASEEVHTAQSVWPWHRTVDQAMYVHRYVRMQLSTKVVVPH